MAARRPALKALINRSAQVQSPYCTPPVVTNGVRLRSDCDLVPAPAVLEVDIYKQRSAFVCTVSPPLLKGRSQSNFRLIAISPEMIVDREESKGARYEKKGPAEYVRRDA
jgi:hypothetical protein